jgi:hypothetical protein
MISRDDRFAYTEYTDKVIHYPCERNCKDLTRRGLRQAFRDDALRSAIG